MRITCSTIDDFIANLADASVAWNVVHVDRTSSDISEHSRDVHLQASAVLDMPGGGQALLQCGEACGRDLLTSDGHQDGTDRQRELTAKLERFCEDRGLRVKPGIIDE